MKVSVVLPTYNEKQNIAKLIKQIKQEFSKDKGLDCEVIVVDDNSPDNTAETVRKIIPNLNNRKFSLKLILRTREKGLPTAVMTGMDKATGDFVCAMDTDLSHPVSHLHEMVMRCLDPEIHLVNATRWGKNGGMKSAFSSKVLSIVINKSLSKSLKLPYTDFTGGFFVIDRSLYAKLNQKEKEFIFKESDYGEYFIKFIAVVHQKKANAVEMPFVYVARVKGQSKTSVLKHGKLYVNAIKDIKRWQKKS